MNATSVGIISMPANGRPTRSVPRGASCVCDSSSSAASISEKMRRQRSRNRAPSAVILFNNGGASSSSGEVPTSCEQMGTNAVSFIKALGLSKVDVLGFSIGGFVAQEITLQAPDLVRRLVLVGTG